MRFHGDDDLEATRQFDDRISRAYDLISEAGEAASRDRVKLRVDAVPALLDEVRRVLTPVGRLGVVALAEPEDERPFRRLERANRWMHVHFPHIIDCRPLDVDVVLGDAGLRVTERERMELWSLPVIAAVARAD